MLQKQKRIVDKELIETVKGLPCLACGKEPCGDAHHVKSRGSGGHDIATNLMPLCREHHVAVHVIGMKKFAKIHMIVRHWLKFAGRSDLLKKDVDIESDMG